MSGTGADEREGNGGCAASVVASSSLAETIESSRCVDPGNLHLPSEFCSQITSGSTSNISLMTKRREKSDRKRMRSRKALALRKFPDARPEICGMVSPLSLSPPQGVTLIRRMASGVPRRWLSSCWILVCVPCDCTYKLTPSKTIAAKARNTPRTIRRNRLNLCTRRRYADQL